LCVFGVRKVANICYRTEPEVDDILKGNVDVDFNCTDFRTSNGCIIEHQKIKIYRQFNLNIDDTVQFINSTIECRSVFWDCRIFINISGEK
jgi:hypothetical protein